MRGGNSRSARVGENLEGNGSAPAWTRCHNRQGCVAFIKRRRARYFNYHGGDRPMAPRAPRESGCPRRVALWGGSQPPGSLGNKGRRSSPGHGICDHGMQINVFLCLGNSNKTRSQCIESSEFAQLYIRVKPTLSANIKA